MCLTPVMGDSSADLASPNPAVRAKAAAILRGSYVPTPRARFEKLLAEIKPGESEQALKTFLASQHVPLEKSLGSMAWSDTYRVDGTWVLRAWGPSSPPTVAGAELDRETEKVWVQMPPGFSGTWIEYFANGQKMHEHRTDDPDDVNDIFYYDNGQPWCVSTNTENTYYFRDGRLQPKDHVTQTP